MTSYEELKATIDSPGAKIIARALREEHKKIYREYRSCPPDKLERLQATQFVLDTIIPKMLERLLNEHLEQPKIGQKKKVWSFWEWLRKIRYKS